MADPAPHHDALDTGDRITLRRIATDTIEHGLRYREPMSIDVRQYSPRLQQRDASFVTVKSAEDDLVGCIGGLEPARPLVLDVSVNSFRAAFHDPRTAGVSRANWPGLEVTISILHSFHDLEVDSSSGLIEVLRPGRDGLIVELRGRRATFLPSVWESLPDPAQFIDELRRKAGIVESSWDPALRWTRYEVESF